MLVDYFHASFVHPWSTVAKQEMWTFFFFGLVSMQHVLPGAAITSFLIRFSCVPVLRGIIHLNTSASRSFMDLMDGGTNATNHGVVSPLCFDRREQFSSLPKPWGVTFVSKVHMDKWGRAATARITRHSTAIIRCWCFSFLFLYSVALSLGMHGYHVFLQNM